MALNASPTAPDRAQTLYERVAGHVLRLIDHHALRPGDKIPSVRKLSGQLAVSISTVLQAYRLLEDQGRIEARPQSGYYVKVHGRVAPGEPEMSRPPLRTTNVTLGDTVLKFLQSGQREGVVPLGAAVSGHNLAPVRKLNRLGSAIARRSPTVTAAYDLPPGCPALRVQVARRMVDAGCALSPDDLITTVGSQEALSLCLRAVAGPGDTIALESPTFYGILQFIEMLGMKALEIPTHPRDGISLPALQEALDRQPIKACLFVTNYHNPLGSCMPEASKRELVRVLAERQVPLIEDDIYGDLGFEAPRPIVCKAFDEQGLVLLCSSFSKTIAAGYRVGWCAPGRWTDEVAKLKLFSTLATPTLPQMAIAEFLANGGYDHHMRTMRRIYRQQVQTMTEMVGRWFPEGTKVTRPGGGFVVWVEMPGAVDALRLHEQAMRHNISVAPGPIFSPKGKFTNCIRLNCGCLWSNEVERAVETVGMLARRMVEGAAGGVGGR